VITRLRRFKTLNYSDRGLILEAAVLLAFVIVGLRIFRLQNFRGMLAWFGPEPGQPDSDGVTRELSAAEKVAWAVNAVANIWPRVMSCLVRAVATEAMLGRRGIRSDLRLGVRHEGDASNPFTAHAWVECKGLIVMGAVDDLGDYHVLPVPARP
jgi:hypothetical protein